MNSLIKNQIVKITNQFNNALEEGLSRFAPRNGFYYVRAFEFRQIRNSTYPFITANWKVNADDEFVAEATFEIALSSLHPAYPTLKMDYANIVGQTLHVFGVCTQLSIDMGKTKSIVIGRWNYDVREPKFFDGTSLLFEALASEIVTLDDDTVVIASDLENGIDNDAPQSFEYDYSFEEGYPIDQIDLTGLDEEIDEEEE